MNTRFTTIIVEDEPRLQQAMLELIAEHAPQLAVIGVEADVANAQKAVEMHQPDLIFLDVNLPPHTGFDLLRSLQPLQSEVIFTTSFDQYAVDAFRYSAVDYLLKPIEPELLKQAVDRFIDRMKGKKSNERLDLLLANLQQPTSSQKKLALPTSTGYLFVTTGEILRCESSNTYTIFYLKDGRQIVISRTLKECEEMLAPNGFFRVHHSHMINLSEINSYIKGEGGSVKLSDGSEVEVSRRRKEEFLSALRRV